MSEWISVKERMPEAEGRYIVCIDGWTSVIPMKINGLGHKYWEVGKYLKKETTSVTHWMPLPAPPKEE